MSASTDLGLSERDNLEFGEAIAEAARSGVVDAEMDLQEDATASVDVEISWSDERRADYVGKIAVRDGTEALASHAFACNACGAGEVIRRVRDETALALIATDWPVHTERAAPETNPHAERAAPETNPPSTTPTPRSSTEHPPANNDRSPRLRATGWGGVGVGAIATITGALFWARDDKVTTRPTSDNTKIERTVIPYRGIGIGLVVGGVATTAVGSVLVLVDIRRRARLTLSPVMGLGLTGVSVTGRF